MIPIEINPLRIAFQDTVLKVHGSTKYCSLGQITKALFEVGGKCWTNM